MGVLIALVMVGIQGITRQAAQTKCVSHLQTLGRVALNYLSDNNGWLFPDKFWYRERFPNGIRDYLGYTAPSYQNYRGIDTVLTCPELKRIYPGKFAQNNIVLNRTYSMNVYAARLNPNGSGRLMPGSPQRVAAIPNPTRMVLFTDGGSTSPDSGEFQTTISEAAPPTTLTYPHRKRQNTVFFDGHVEGLTAEVFTSPPSLREFWGNLQREQ